MRHLILCQTVLLFLAEQAKRLALPDEVEPKTHSDQPAPTTFEKRGKKSASHDGAVGRGAESALCPLA